LHPSNFSSPEEVLASESRVEILQSWQSKQVYQFDKEKSPLGALDFYEEAVIRPDLVLEDLLKVLYPELFQKNDTKWYRNIYIF
jgi:iron complex transport system substrate-binding protein